MKKVAAIVVLYNSYISNTNIINYLDDPFIDLWFVDNSTNNNIKSCNKKYANNNNYYYIDMQTNVGLSKAYNYTINKIKTTNNYTHILLSDDDTIYNHKYLEELQQAINTVSDDLILPTIINNANHKIMSPIFLSNLPLVKSHKLKKNKAKRIMGINSGTCAKLSVFNHWQFNENLFLYFTDIDFYTNNVNKNKLTYTVLKTPIYQNCSGFEAYNQDTIKQIQRVLNDAKCFYNTQSFGIIKYLIYKIMLIVRSTLLHKQLIILKLLFTKIEKSID